MVNLTIAISTMDQQYLKNDKLFFLKNVNYLIVNQTRVKQHDTFEENKTVLHFNEQGLSKSRNRAIENAKSDWVMFGDDDLDYSCFDPDRLSSALACCDILLVSNLDDSGPQFKERLATYSDIMKCASWCIIANLRAIKKNEIRFDEDFGLGSQFISTEENSFLLDAKKKGLVIRCTNVAAVNHVGLSTGFIWTNELVRSKGAFIRRNFGRNSWIVVLLFSLKKYRRADFTLFQFVRACFTGWTGYHDKK